MRPFAATVRAEARRVRERGPAALLHAARLGGAAVVSYVIAQPIVRHDPKPVTAALTALLIVQVTLVGTLADTARRLLSVVAGVTIAIGVSTLVGFSTWSLLGVVVAAILVGQLLRLGSHTLEVPISAMLVLSAGAFGIAALDRVIETLIGAGVGLLVNLVFPPAVRTRSAGEAVERYADSLAQLLERTAATLHDGPATIDEVRAWLQEVRAVSERVDRVDRALAEAGESRRLNPRALGTTDTTPDLRSGLDALAHSAVALRAVFRSLADGALPTSSPDEGDDGSPVRADEQDPDDNPGEDLRRAIAVLLSDLARAISAFGTLVRAEIDESDEPHTAELTDALDAVQEARVRLTELLFVDPRESPDQWQLRGSLLAAVERVLAELDLEQRRRLRQQRRERVAGSWGPAAVAAQRLRSTTRRVVTEASPPAHRRRHHPRDTGAGR